jgi:hypothetical protein
MAYNELDGTLLERPSSSLQLAALGMVAPSRGPACLSRSWLVLPLAPRRSAPLRSSARRSSCSRRTSSYWHGWACREGNNTDNTLCICQAMVSLHRIRRRQKAISRGKVKGKSFRRNGSTEHTTEKEKPKHSPGPKRNDLKERLRGLQSIMHMRVVLSRISPYLNNHS